jgi:hypothetical protein
MKNYIEGWGRGEKANKKIKRQVRKAKKKERD